MRRLSDNNIVINSNEYDINYIELHLVHHWLMMSSSEGPISGSSGVQTIGLLQSLSDLLLGIALINAYYAIYSR